jgi:SAM-dependent methyltransferase
MWIVIIAVIVFIVFLVSVSWTDTRGAPWVPTTMNTVRKMLTMAEVGPDDTVYDLGCGDGRTIITAARKYGARAVGVEIDPFRYAWCQVLITLLGLRNRVQVIYGDFFSQDLSGADVVTCYLLQKTNNKLEKKFRSELASGTRVVSNTFYFSGLQKVREDGDVNLYLFCPDPDMKPSY